MGGGHCLIKILISAGVLINGRGLLKSKYIKTRKPSFMDIKHLATTVWQNMHDTSYIEAVP